MMVAVKDVIDPILEEPMRNFTKHNIEEITSELSSARSCLREANKLLENAIVMIRELSDGGNTDKKRRED